MDTPGPLSQFALAISQTRKKVKQKPFDLKAKLAKWCICVVVPFDKVPKIIVT